MAQNMQDIKRRIKSVTSTEHITNAMKLVAASKFRKAKVAFDKTNEYLNYVTDSISEVFRDMEDISSDYIKGTREIKTTCYLIITSNKGLCGGFNTNVIKKAEEKMASQEDKPVLATIGLRGHDYFQKRNYEIVNDFFTPADTISFIEARKITQPIIKMYEKGEIDELVMIYTKFINSMEQEVQSKVLLPLDTEKIPEADHAERQVEYEPTPEEVFDYLVPKYVETEIYKGVVESAVCEFIARRVAMENATDNANDMLDNLSLFYNRARQAAITNELIEIVAGSEALK